MSKTIRNTIFEIPLIYEIIGEEDSFPLGPRQRLNIVPNFSKICGAVSIEDESLIREDKMLVDIGGHNDRSFLIILLAIVEETISNRSFLLQLPVKIQIILGRHVPIISPSLPGINNRQFLLYISLHLLVLSMISWCSGEISIGTSTSSKLVLRGKTDLRSFYLECDWRQMLPIFVFVYL